MDAESKPTWTYSWRPQKDEPDSQTRDFKLKYLGQCNFRRHYLHTITSIQNSHKTTQRHKDTT